MSRTIYLTWTETGYTAIDGRFEILDNMLRDTRNGVNGPFYTWTVIDTEATRVRSFQAISLNNARAWIARKLDSERSLPERLAARDAAREASGRWVPASGGTETPVTFRDGTRALYCWHTGTGRHAYINLATDIEMTDAEVEIASR